jgi:hypothetical protein
MASNFGPGKCKRPSIAPAVVLDPSGLDTLDISRG